MQLKGKKILVTGGAGFIGSNLVDKLIEDNYVTVLDNLSSGEHSNIAHHLGKDNFTFAEGDIRELDLVRSLVKDSQVIFHMAVQCLRLSFTNPYLVHEVNATGSLNLCQAAYESGIERFIYCSSSEVYGTAKTAPMNEDHVLEPTTSYGASKLAGEAYARSFFLSFGMPVIIVRPFNTYGPREHLAGAYGEVIPRFALRIMNNLPPIVFGDGLQTRDFTDVRDSVKGLIAAASCDRLVGQAVNIAAGQEVTINDIAETIIKLEGKAGKLGVSHLDPRPADVRRHFADVKKARDTAGFKASINIEDGLQHYLDWVKEQNFDLSKLQQEEVIINWA